MQTRLKISSILLSSMFLFTAVMPAMPIMQGMATGYSDEDFVSQENENQENPTSEELSIIESEYSLNEGDSEIVPENETENEMTFSLEKDPSDEVQNSEETEESDTNTISFEETLSKAAFSSDESLERSSAMSETTVYYVSSMEEFADAFESVNNSSVTDHTIYLTDSFPMYLSKSEQYPYSYYDFWLKNNSVTILPLDKDIEIELMDSSTDTFFYVTNGASITFGSNDSPYSLVFDGNNQPYDGEFVYIEGSTVYFCANLEIKNISANSGRLASIAQVTSSGTLYIQGAYLHDNLSGSSTTLSAAITVMNGSYLYVSNGTVMENNTSISTSSSTSYGGAIYGNSSTISISDSYFYSNGIDMSGTSYGGGIYSAYCDLTITSSTFSGNESIYGGAVSIYVKDTTSVSISDTIFTSNSGYMGGALFIYDSGTDGLPNAFIEGCSIESNYATYGGGIMLYKGVLSLRNTSIIQTVKGAGIYLISGTEIILDDDNVIQNNYFSTSSTNNYNIIASSGNKITLYQKNELNTPIIGIYFNGDDLLAEYITFELHAEGSQEASHVEDCVHLIFSSDISGYIVDEFIDGTQSKLRLVKECLVYFDSLGGSSVNTLSTREGGYVEEPANPEQEGYSFVGWYLNYDDGEYSEPFDFDTTAITEDITLYAKWEKLPVVTVTYTSSFDTEDVPDMSTYFAYSEVNIYYELSIVGYAFKGWSDGDKVYAPNETYTLQDENITFTAVWEINSNDVEFYANESNDNSIVVSDLPETKTYTYGSIVDVSEFTPTRTGYVFTGWTTETVVIEENSFSMPDETVCLYATWEDAWYSVEYETTLSSVTVESTTVKHDAVIDAIPTTDDILGYTFTGWYIDETYTETWDFDSMTVTEPIVLYGVYSPITYTVTFLSDDVIVDEQTYTVEDISIIAPDISEVEGYDIVWEEYEIDSSNPQNITVILVWTLHYNDVIYLATTADDSIIVSNMPTEEFWAYGEVVILSEIVPVRSGYTFLGWETDDVDIINNQFIMPDSPVYLYALWEEDVDDTTSSTSSTSMYTDTGSTDCAIQPEVANPPTGHNFNWQIRVICSLLLLGLTYRILGLSQNPEKRQ